MADEDCIFDTPAEPQAVRPKASMIDRCTSSSRSQLNPYQDFSIKKILNKGKFAVFLTECPSKAQNFAMKVFPLKGAQPDKCFQNEIQFASLNHPNVIKIVYFEPRTTIKLKENSVPASMIMSELAPYGDLYDFIDNYRNQISEKLVRTFFRQLISGLEYLHSKKIAHLDIKPENILLGGNYQIKIADFDLSCFVEEPILRTKGTEFYRAPELINGRCSNGFAADIYSAGVLLFVMKCEGRVPHTELELYKGIDLLDLLSNNTSEFWRKHCEIQGKEPSEFSDSFKELVNNMLKFKSEDRWTISEIKNSRWYNEPVFTNEELKKYMKTMFKCRK